MLITASPKDAEPGAPARTSADRCDRLFRSVERLTRWLDRVRLPSVRTCSALARLAFALRVVRRSATDSSPAAAAARVWRAAPSDVACSGLGFALGFAFGFGLGSGLGATVAVEPMSPYRGAAGTTSTRAAGTRAEPWTPSADAALAAGAEPAERTFGAALACSPSAATSPLETTRTAPVRATVVERTGASARWRPGVRDDTAVPLRTPAR